MSWSIPDEVVSVLRAAEKDRLAPAGDGASLLDRSGIEALVPHRGLALLLDRVTEPPTTEWLADKRRFFLDERERLGLEKISDGEFANEFRLQTVQRCLKAIGTFSFQSSTRGKTYFVPFIKPMFRIVLRAIENIERFPTLRLILEKEV